MVQLFGRAITVLSKTFGAMNHITMSDTFVKNSVFQIKWRHWM